MLCIVPLGVVTVTKPLVAPDGATVVSKVCDLIANRAAVPLKETLVVPLNPCPRIPTVWPIFPVYQTKLTKGPSVVFIPKIVPRAATPVPSEAV